MRKTMVGVLSVAGLLAVVLAVASGSATAQAPVTARVVTFVTDDVPGTYEISWQTQGGCDPTKRDDNTANATDAASGTNSRTVANHPDTKPFHTVGPDNDDGSRKHIPGEPAEFAVVIATHCIYDWEATFTSGLPGDEGAGCIVGQGIVDPESGAVTYPEAPATLTRDGEITVDITVAEPRKVLDVIRGDCSVAKEVKIGITPFPTVGDKTTTPEIPPTYDPFGRYLPLNRGPEGEIHPVNPDAGAILNTTFTVTATPVKNSDPECKVVTDETEVNDSGTTTRNDDRVEVTLNLLEQTLENKQKCQYIIAADVPDGFSAPGDTNVHVLTTFGDFMPVTKEDGTPDGAPVGVGDCFTSVDEFKGTSDKPTAVTGTRCVKLEVHVADRSIYVLQNVTGDSGRAYVHYHLTENWACGFPNDIPLNLRGEGGIISRTTDTLVELREGFYNISPAVMYGLEYDIHGRFRARRLALNYDAEPCIVKATVSDLPGNCSASVNGITADLSSGVDDAGRAIIRFDITCSDDMGGDDMDMDMGGDDMDMDMGGDDMDMDMDGDDMDMDMDMDGPKPDKPTG